MPKRQLNHGWGPFPLSPIIVLSESRDRGGDRGRNGNGSESEPATSVSWSGCKGKKVVEVQVFTCAIEFERTDASMWAWAKR